jgi:hypothetical protein
MSCVCKTRRRLRQLVGGFKDASPPCTHDRRLSPKTTHTNLRPPMYPATVPSTRAIWVTEGDRAPTPRGASYRGRLAKRRKRAVWAQPGYTRQQSTPRHQLPVDLHSREEQRTHSPPSLLLTASQGNFWGQQQPPSPLCWETRA